MAKIGLVVRAGVPEAIELGRDILKWSKKKSHDILCEKQTAEALELKNGYTAAEIANSCSPIIALGGDGTLIGIARYVQGSTPIMLGVNFGRLGFLTEVSPSELFKTLETTMGGTAQFGRRHMLYAEVLRGGREVFSMQAVNDAVIHNSVLGKLTEVDFSVDSQEVTRFRSDGLIISTPTGSTAYSLSAGGPIVHPTLSVFVVTPICSHSLTHRPLVLSIDSELIVTIPEDKTTVRLSIDGQEGFDLMPNDIVRVTKAENTVIFVRSPTKSYFRILREKLSWGVGEL